MLKKIAVVALLALLFVLGFGLARLLYQQKQEQVSRSQSTVLLEKVQKVCKLVTVEGHFSEIYDETKFREMTFYLPLPTTWKFSKQAIMQVEGKVLVGYDMEKVNIRADSLTRTIVISNLPEPQILAIDHELRYKNLEESFFNSFTAEDYTQLNKNAKEVLRKKALESKLLDEARQQGNQMLEVIKYMAQAVGWQVDYEGVIQPPPTDSLSE